MNGGGRAFDELLDQMSENVRKAFLAAIENIRTTAKLREIEEHLKAGDVDAVLRALNLQPEYFAGVRDAIDEAFGKGGQLQVSLATSLSAIPFNRRHWAAEEWAQTNGSRFIVEITESTREGVREAVVAGLQQGTGPGPLARQIVGTLNASTRKREGGILGLTGQQLSYVDEMRAALSSDGGLPVGVSRLDENGEPIKKFWLKRDGTLGSVFGARDRRFDRTIKKALKTGKPLAKADIDQIIQRYSDGLLSYRGGIVARTEAHQALNAGRIEAMRQTAENADIPLNRIEMKWQATKDLRTRDTHRSMGGQTVQFGGTFVSPRGAVMGFPGDTSRGAPASEVVACRCTITFEIKRGSDGNS